MHKIIFAMALLLTACTNRPGNQQAAIPGAGPYHRTDTSYMHTGFYFLTNERQGITMQNEATHKTFTLARQPFASVQHIAATTLSRTAGGQDPFIELCLTFDSTGTRQLVEGTTSFQPKLAVVIANRLLYVADNLVSVKTGVMCVILDGYTRQEAEALKKQVDSKQ